MASPPYISRTLETTIRLSLDSFPGVLLTGPRQSGKTTLLRTMLAKTHAYVSLDDLEQRRFAATDPHGFLRAHGAPLIIDEVQYAPELLSAIKLEIDEHRSEHGRYVVTGSQDILMRRDVTETLAGRVAVLQLHPLTQREVVGDPDRPLPWDRDETADGEPQPAPFWEALLTGGYPEVQSLAPEARDIWFRGYVQTYLERDVRTLREIGDLMEFRAFLELIASRTGQLLNLSGMANELGIAVNTAKAWLSVLTATYQVIVVRPFHANTRKRLVKTPKVYIADTGLACHLAGIETANQASRGPMAGGLVETAVAIEVFRSITHRGAVPRLHHWRTATGTKVDLLVRSRGVQVPIEVKTSGVVRERTLHGLDALLDDESVDTAPTGWLVHAGSEESRQVSARISSIPFAVL